MRRVLLLVMKLLRRVRAVAIAAVADPVEFTVSTVVTAISGPEKVEATDAVVELDTAQKTEAEQVAAAAPASQPLAFGVEMDVEKTSGVENIPEEMAPETVSAEEPSTESIGSEETSAESISPEEESVDSTGSGATAAAPAGSEGVSGEAKVQPTGEQKEFTVFTSVGEQAETRAAAVHQIGAPVTAEVEDTAAAAAEVEPAEVPIGGADAITNLETYDLETTGSATSVQQSTLQ